MRAITLLVPSLLPLALAASCATSTTERLGLEEPSTVQGFELERYLGTWYEIGNFPQSFQEGCTGTTATYTLKDDGNVEVLNRCFKGGLDGPEDVARGTARPVDIDRAKLEVSFFQPFWGAYWVLELGPDYDYAVVGHPSRDYLWILAREPRLPSEVQDGILERLESVHGYELDRFVLTTQE
ncbi:MAG: lipocalin family protein [Deltaproteobacteria bacterium]|nr:lipocalin family protein [Deltaproteobacteria bacterium]